MNAKSCFKNIMHHRDRGCVRTLRPLFVYATAYSSPTQYYSIDIAQKKHNTKAQ